MLGCGLTFNIVRMMCGLYVLQIFTQLCGLVNSLTNVYQCEAVSEIVSIWMKNKRISSECIEVINENAQQKTTTNSKHLPILTTTLKKLQAN